MPEQPDPGIEPWRAEFLDASTRALALLACLWTVFLFTDLRGSFWVAVTVLAAGIASAIRRLSFRLRGGIMLFALAVVVFGSGVTAGAAPANITGSAIAVIVAGILFGPRWAGIVWGLTIVLMGVAWSLAARNPHYSTVLADLREPVNLVRMLATYVALSSVLVVGIVVVIRRLGTTLDELRAAAESERRARLEAEEANERREQVLRQMAEAQKHELMGQMAGSVAHDINNSLQFLTFQAERIGKGALSAEQARTVSRDILDVCQQTSSLAKQLLALGQRSILDREVFDVGSELGTMARAIERTLPPNVTLQVAAADALHVSMDRGQLKQALLNLTLNSIHAMPNGGELLLGASRSDDGQGDVFVRDSGTGMDDETVTKIFEPFFTTKGSGGTGLGLASVKAIVEQHHGQVSVRSKLGEGTEVLIRLPSHSGLEIEPAKPERAITDLRGCHVLVVDDDPRVRRAVAQMLASAGAEILEAKDADSALELATSHEVDVLCTDAMMPGMPTRELIDRLRARDPAFPVLVCSAYVESELLRRGIETKSLAYLAKPFSAQQLTERIASLWKRRSQPGSARGE
ncbi:MAG: response regulator [Polyangiales bacterium]